MTFNQWCAGKCFDGPLRLALNAVWDAMTGECDDANAGRLLNDLLDALPEPTDGEEW